MKAESTSGLSALQVVPPDPKPSVRYRLLSLRQTTSHRKPLIPAYRNSGITPPHAKAHTSAHHLETRKSLPARPSEGHVLSR